MRERQISLLGINVAPKSNRTLFSQVSIHATNRVGGINVGDSVPVSYSGDVMKVKPTVTKDSRDRLTYEQANALVNAHDLYTLPLAQRKYELISTNYTKYLSLLHTIRTINLKDPRLHILLTIAEDAILGAVNSVTVNTNYTYSTLKISSLNKDIEEILSNKNVKSMISADITGNMSATKVFKLSPILSYYIILYGVPKKGVGFDPAKLEFLSNLPDIINITNTKRPIV